MVKGAITLTSYGLYEVYLIVDLCTESGMTGHNIAEVLASNDKLEIRALGIRIGKYIKETGNTFGQALLTNCNIPEMHAKIMEISSHTGSSSIYNHLSGLMHELEMHRVLIYK